MNKFRVGSKVQITKGTFKGMKGDIISPRNKKTKRYMMGNSIATFHVPKSYLVKLKRMKGR